MDCHFVQDAHGNTKLYGEVRAAIEIGCVDCHGTVDRRANLITSGPASDTSGTPDRPGRNLKALVTPFEAPGSGLEVGDKILQRVRWSSPTWRWEITQTRATRSTPATRPLQRQGGTPPRLCSSMTPVHWCGAICQYNLASSPVRADRQVNELHRVPHFVEPKLLRLSLASKGEPQDSAAS